MGNTAEILAQLNWVQRQQTAILLYKADWKGAVAAVPEPLQAEMIRLCEENSLMDLAKAFDPATEGGLQHLFSVADNPEFKFKSFVDCVFPTSGRTLWARSR
jgi:hypothetical protein